MSAVYNNVSICMILLGLFTVF